MKGIICYYSSTGNTKLACEYIVRKIKNADFELHNITKEGIPDLTSYDVFCFATFTDWWGVPKLFEDYIENLPMQNNKYAFVFNTYAQHSGKTLKILADKIRSKGFNIIGGYSLHSPANHPPAVAKGLTFEDSPNPRELKGFNEFISSIDLAIGRISGYEKVEEAKINIGIFNSLLRTYPRTKSREFMGKKYVDEKLCIKCEICKENCPYHAIEIADYPLFDNMKCYGCWACFNCCPQKAIYTETIRGIGHYPKPIKHFKEKLDSL